MRHREIRYPIIGERFHGNPRRWRRNPVDAFGVPPEAHLVPVWPKARKKAGQPLTGPAFVASYFADAGRSPVERLYVMLLDSQNYVLGVVIAAQGSVNEASVAPREILAPAISARAAGFILVHNHPSGRAYPSAADRALSLRVGLAAAIVSIPMLDHVVLGADGEFESLEAIMGLSDEVRRRARDLV